MEVNEAGNKTGNIFSNFNPGDKIGCLDIRGAGLAYSRALINSFNKLSNTVHNEDIVMTARALLKSQIGIINEPLVLYRSHQYNRAKKNWLPHHFNKTWYNKNVLEAKRVLAYSEQIKSDLIGFEKNKIPDINRVFNENNIAKIKIKLINNSYLQASELNNIIANIKLLKFAIGLIVFRLFNNIYDF